MTNLQKELRELTLKINSPIPKEKRFKFNIKDLKIGSFFNLFQELFIVIDLYTYTETKWNFKPKKSKYMVTELKIRNLVSGEIKFIEWEFEDYLLLYSTEKEIALNDISFSNKQITKKDLDIISDNESGSVYYNNQKFNYIEDDTWAAMFNSGRLKNIPVKLFEFKSSLGHNLTIEIWHDDNEKPDKEAYISKKIYSSDLEIIQL